MMAVTGTVVRRASLGLALLAVIWAAGMAATGGFSVRLAGVRVSSHAVLNPLLLALAAAMAARWLARPLSRATLLADLAAGWREARRVSPATYVLIIGIALRLWFWLLDPPLWLDEEMIGLNLRDRTFTRLVGALWLGQAAPLGWMLTERIIGLAFGFSELCLRALPVAFGVATVVAAWWAGRRWLSTAGAAVFVFFVSAGEWMFHFSLEVKHYSADAFFGLLLPLLVVWALEASNRRVRLRRAAIWWIVAAAGQALSMGGLLVAPACALGLILMFWQRDGWRSAAVAAAVGVGWLAIFALDYAATLRFAVSSPFLRGIWSNQMAPEGANFSERLMWLRQLAAPLALIPGGTARSMLFWATALCGFIAARPRRLGAILAAVPLSAAVLGLARVTPLYERFVLWALPAMYFGIALALDAGIRSAKRGTTLTSITRIAGTILAAAVIVLCADVGLHGYSGIFGTHHGATNRAMDDRTAVEWLVAERRPGDALFTTHLGAPAVWWYAGVPLSRPTDGASLDGIPIFEVELHAPNPRCSAASFDDAFAGRARALVYVGFEDGPKGFKETLFDALHRIGTITAMRNFGISTAAIVELTPNRADSAAGVAESPRRCFSAKPAMRW